MDAASPCHSLPPDCSADGSNRFESNAAVQNEAIAPLLALPSELFGEIASTLTLVGIVGFALSNRQMLARYKEGRLTGYAALQAIRHIVDGIRSGDLVVEALDRIATEPHALQPALLRHLSSRINGLNLYSHREYPATSIWSKLVEAHWDEMLRAGTGAGAMEHKRDLLIALWFGIGARACCIQQFMAVASARESLMTQIAALPEPHTTAALNAIRVSDNTVNRHRRLETYPVGNKGTDNAADGPCLRFTDRERPFYWTLDGTVTVRVTPVQQRLFPWPLFITAVICMASYFLEQLYTCVFLPADDNQ